MPPPAGSHGGKGDGHYRDWEEQAMGMATAHQSGGRPEAMEARDLGAAALAARG